MKIQKITSRNRRDFSAILECEHCKSTQKLKDGYDDSYYHKEVIPTIVCISCKKKAGEDYLPIATKYSDKEIV